MANIILQLKAKHFYKTEYSSNGYCSISKSYKELTGNSCLTGADNLSDLINRKDFDFTWYNNDLFDYDKRIAQSHNFDETVIREIELIEV